MGRETNGDNIKLLPSLVPLHVEAQGSGPTPECPSDESSLGGAEGNSLARHTGLSQSFSSNTIQKETLSQPPVSVPSLFSNPAH